MSLFSPKRPVAQQPTVLHTLRVQTASYGQAIPIVYGQNRISGKLIWYGDFTPIAQTSKQATGGKGLGGGTTRTTSYTYTAAVAIALCEGPIQQLCNVWDTKGTLLLVAASENFTVPTGGGSYQVAQHANYVAHYGVARADAYSVVANDFGSDGPVTLAGTQKTPMSLVASSPAAGQYTLNPATATFALSAADAGKQVTITYVYAVPNSNSNGQPLQQLALTLFTGTRPQSPWPYLTSNHPGQDLGYNGIAYVAASAMDLGSSGSLPNYTYEVLGLLPFGGGITDAEPGAIINDLLTNPFYGASWPSTLIGDYSNFSAYAIANGLLFSPVIDAQQTAAAIIDDLADLANGAAIWSEGVLKLKSFGDTTTIANGAIFIPDTAPVYDLSDRDFIRKSNDDPVIVTRKSRADAVNDVKIEFVNRANSYNVEIAEDKDDAGIALYGLKSGTPRQAHAITDATVAKKVANHKRLRSVYIDGGNSYRFTLGWQYILLEPMDLVTLTDSNLGLSKHPVRITSIKENDNGELDFEAEDFPWGTATPTAYPYSSGAGFAPNQQADPGSVNAPIVFEANNRMSLSTAYELWMGVSGGPNWGGCHLWLSIDGNSYRQIGTIHGAARMGALTASLASGADPDVTNTLAVDLSQSAGTLTSGTLADADQYHTLCYVDGELITYETATLTGANKYNLTYLRRGSLGSPISAHSAGSAFLRLDDAVFVYEFDPTLVGKTIYLKFTSFNKFELMEQSLANATAYQFTISGSFGGGVRQATWLPPIFSAVATPTGITFYWNGTNGSGSLLLYRDDGTPSYAEFGLLAVTGLSANTTYYFYPYVDQSLIVNSLGLDAVQFVGGGVGSPAIALTSRSQAAAVAQGGLNRIPLSDGAIAVTTPNSGMATFTGLGGSLRKV
ncbi:MAG TPA: phage tail protein [Terriglobales bacterium]|nr:phage tail protein [Terriglobales bacterium]